jgi:hypothetical protein
MGESDGERAMKKGRPDIVDEEERLATVGYGVLLQSPYQCESMGETWDTMTQGRSVGDALQDGAARGAWRWELRTSLTWKLRCRFGRMDNREQVMKAEKDGQRWIMQ